MEARCGDRQEQEGRRVPAQSPIELELSKGVRSSGKIAAGHVHLDGPATELDDGHAPPQAAGSACCPFHPRPSLEALMQGAGPPPWLMDPSLNAGSSSLKFSVFLDSAEKPEPLLRGQFEGLLTHPRFEARDAPGPW
jgi:hypothetical protein